MKVLMIKLVLLFVSSSAFAAVDYISVCDRLDISFSRGIEKCQTAVRGAEHIDQGAVEVCKKISFTDEKVNCIKESLNKSYFASELKVCSNKSFSKKIANCMKVSGQAKEFSDGYKGMSSKLLLKKAKRLIHKGRYQQALLSIDRAIDKID